MNRKSENIKFGLLVKYYLNIEVGRGREEVLINAFFATKMRVELKEVKKAKHICK